MAAKSILPQKEIESLIYTIRSMQVMLDEDLAEMYEVETKRLNEQVNRNSERFPDSFRFQLTENEWKELRSHIATSKKDDDLRSQIATSNTKRGGRRYLPYVFTEQGVAMLSAVLRSETAVGVSIRIMNAFVEMRKLLLSNAVLFQRIDKIELKQLESEKKFEQIFKALEGKKKKEETGIFFNGQVMDAYVFVAKLVKQAKKSIVLIDNYIDETVLILFSKRKNNVKATIYTRQINEQMQLDLKKHNAQYPPIEIKTLANSHDRFLIIDNKELYHIGASLKDLGKKWFAFSRMDSLVNEILNRVK